MIKKYLVFFIIASFNLMLEAQELPNLIPFKINDKFGYVNKKGKLIIEPKYSDAFPFYPNFDIGIVKDSIGYFYINHNGDRLSSYLVYDISDSQYPNSGTVNIPGYPNYEGFQFDSFHFLKCDDLFYVKDSLKEYLIDKKGQLKSKKYDEIRDYGEYCVTIENGLLGIIANNGDEICPPLYDRDIVFTCSMLKLKRKNEVVYFDITSKKMLNEFDANLKIKNSSEHIYIDTPLNNKLILRYLKKSWVYVLYDSVKHTEISPHYSYLSKLDENRLFFRNSNNIGILTYNCDTLLIIKDKEIIRNFSLNKKFKLIYVKEDTSKWSKYNYDGKFKGYENVDGFSSTSFDNRIIALNNDKFIIIDSKNRKVVLDSLFMSGSKDVLLYQNNGKWGLKNIYGKIITSPIYDSKFHFIYGVSKVTRNGEFFYVDYRGIEYKK